MSKENQMFENMAEAILEDYASSYSKMDKDGLARYIRAKYDEYNEGCRKSEWISVEDRLPELYKDVITYDMSIGVDIDSVLSNGEFVLGRRVTHWMPLPEAPEGGAK